MNNSIRWGILATGVIARNFAETAAKMGDVKIQAASSRSIDKANAFADEFSIPTRARLPLPRTRMSTSSTSPRPTARTMRT